MAGGGNIDVRVNLLQGTNELANSLKNLQASMNNLQMPKNIGDSFNSQVDSWIKKSENLKEVLSTVGTKTGMQDAIKSASKLENEFNIIVQKAEQITGKKYDISFKMNGLSLIEDYAKKIDEVTTKTEQYQQLQNKKQSFGQEVAKQAQQYEKLIKAVSEASREVSRLNLAKKEKESKNQTVTQEELDELKQYKLNLAAAEAAKKDFITNTKVGKGSDVDSYRQINDQLKELNTNMTALGTKMTSLQTGNPFKELLSGLTQINPKLTEGITSWDDLINRVALLKQQSQQSGIDGIAQDLLNASNAGKDFGTALKGGSAEIGAMTSQTKSVEMLISRFEYMFSLTSMLMKFKQQITQTIEKMKELDATMTEMAVVTDKGVGDYWDQLPEYTQRANELGIAIKDVYEATTLYLQQGLSANQATALTNKTLQMARIAGLDAAEATDRMTNALRGFNMELNETSSTRVADVYSNLAAHSASNVDEISTAMTKVASIANSANMSFENTAAFISTIVENTRESAETAGTALKTVIARFSEVKKAYSEGDLTATDSESGEEINVNKVQEALRTAGVDMSKFFTGEQGLDEVFLQLSEKWNSLDTLTQRYIATMAAGSRQQSRFIALMQDNARTTELVGLAQDSAGASQDQFNKTLESMEAKLAKLENAWNTFWMKMTDSGIIKGVVDALTGILDAINSISSAFGDLGGVFNLSALIVGAKLASKAVLSLTAGAKVKLDQLADSTEKNGKSFLNMGKNAAAGSKATTAETKNSANAINEFVSEKNNEAAVYKTTTQTAKAANAAEQSAAKAKSFSSVQQDVFNASMAAGVSETEEYTVATAAEGAATTEEAVQKGIATGAISAETDAKILETAVTEGETIAEKEGIVAEKENIVAEKAGFVAKLFGIGTNEAYTLSTIKGTLANKKDAIAEKLKALWTKISSASTEDATAAQNALNLSILNCPIGWIIAGIALLVGGLIFWANSVDTAEKKQQRLNETAEAMAESAEKIAEKYENLKTAISDLKSEQKTLDGLTKGTQEWYDQVSIVNDKFNELLDIAPELTEFMKIEDGLMQWEEKEISVDFDNDGSTESLNAEQAQEELLKKAESESNRAKLLARYSKLYANQFNTENKVRNLKEKAEDEGIDDDTINKIVQGTWKVVGEQIVDSENGDKISDTKLDLNDTAILSALKDLQSSVIENTNAIKTERDTARLIAQQDVINNGLADEDDETEVGVATNLAVNFGEKLASWEYWKDFTDENDDSLAEFLEEYDGTHQVEDITEHLTDSKMANQMANLIIGYFQDVQGYKMQRKNGKRYFVDENDEEVDLQNDTEGFLEFVRTSGADYIDKEDIDKATKGIKDRFGDKAFVNGSLDASGLTNGIKNSGEKEVNYINEYTKYKGYSAQEFANAAFAGTHTIEDYKEEFTDNNAKNYAEDAMRTIANKNGWEPRLTKDNETYFVDSMDNEINWEEHADELYKVTSKNFKTGYTDEDISALMDAGFTRNEAIKQLETAEKDYDNLSDSIDANREQIKNLIDENFTFAERNDQTIGARLTESELLLEAARNEGDATALQEYFTGLIDSGQTETYEELMELADKYDLTTQEGFSAFVQAAYGVSDETGNAAEKIGEYTGELEAVAANLSNMSVAASIKTKLAQGNTVFTKDEKEYLVNIAPEYSNNFQELGDDFIALGVSINDLQSAVISNTQAQLEKSKNSLAAADKAKLIYKEWDELDETTKQQENNNDLEGEEKRAYDNGGTLELIREGKSVADTNLIYLAYKLGIINESDFKETTEEGGKTTFSFVNDSTKEDVYAQVQETIKLATNEDAYEEEERSIILTEAIGKGLDTTELQAEADAIKLLNNNLSETEALQQAITSLSSRKGLNALIETYDDWTGIINETTGGIEKTKEGIKTYAAFKQAVTDLLGGNIELSESFFEQAKNIELIRAAANGSTEALAELQKAAAIDYLKNIDSESLADNGKEAVEDLVKYLQTVELPDLEVGAQLNDEEFIKALNDLLKSGALTRDQMNGLLSTIGLKTDFKMVWKTIGFIKVPTFEIKSLTAGSTYKGNVTPTSTRSGSSSSSTKKTSGVSQDRQYNILAKIERLTEEKTKYESEYEQLLHSENTTIKEILNSSKKQTQNIKDQISAQKQLISGRKQQLKELYSGGKEEFVGTDKSGNEVSHYMSTWEKIYGFKIKDYVQYNTETGIANINWDKFYKLGTTSSTSENNSNMLSIIENFLSTFESYAGDIKDAEQEILNQEQALYDLQQSQFEAYTTVLDEVLAGWLKLEQERIDTSSEISQAIEETQSNILDALTESIELSRQIRDNTETEEDITDKEARLAYLKRDTSGANDSEILKLEKELEDKRQDYQDDLVDQALDKLSDNIDKSAEQRTKQIELQQKILDSATETGKYANEIEQLLIKAYGLDAVSRTEAQTAYRKANDYDQKTKSQQQKIDEDFNEKFLAGASGVKNAIYQTGQLIDNKGDTWENISGQFWYNKNTGKTEKLTNDSESLKLTSTGIDVAGTIIKASNLWGSGNEYGTHQMRTDTNDPFWKVQILQDALISLGFADKNELIDKKEYAETFGQATKEALTNWQKAAGITSGLGAYGQIDREIMAYIEAGYTTEQAGALYKKSKQKSNSSSSSSSTGSSLNQSNKYANNRISSLTSDVYYGANKSTILTFQKGYNDLIKAGKINAQKLSEDGLWGPNTKNAIITLQKKIGVSADGWFGKTSRNAFKNSAYKAYKTGGLADYTGPAWLDGTPSKPELVLNQTDTQNFIKLKDILAQFMSSGIGHATAAHEQIFNISIDVESIANDYDVEQLATKLKQEIYNDSMYRNNTTLGFIR